VRAKYFSQNFSLPLKKYLRAPLHPPLLVRKEISRKVKPIYELVIFDSIFSVSEKLPLNNAAGKMSWLCYEVKPDGIDIARSSPFQVCIFWYVF